MAPMGKIKQFLNGTLAVYKIES